MCHSIKRGTQTKKSLILTLILMYSPGEMMITADY